MPANLTDGDPSSESYDLPEEVHEAQALIAATKAAKPFVTEAEGRQRLADYEKDAWAKILEVARENDAAHAGQSRLSNSRFISV